MGEYDKALMDCYSKVYAAAIRNGKSDKADYLAKAAVKDFKAFFHRPDFRKGGY